MWTGNRPGTGKLYTYDTKFLEDYSLYEKLDMAERKNKQLYAEYVLIIIFNTRILRPKRISLENKKECTIWKLNKVLLVKHR